MKKRERILYVTDFHEEQVLAGIVAYAREAGWELDSEMRLHGFFPAPAGAKGILAIAVRERISEWLRTQNHCAIVRILASKGDLPYPAVEADYFAAGKAAAQHLLELGFAHYAFYYTSAGKDAHELQDGFSAELKTAGREAAVMDFVAAHPGVWNEVNLPLEERCRWLAAELEKLPKPLAVITGDDRRSAEVLAAAEMIGLRVPEEVAVVGCDNRAVELELSPIPLSSVDMNFRRIGWEAAALLDHLMRGGKAPSAPLKVPPIGVVGRRSTATFVTDSEPVAAAMRYLREHYHEPLSLSELARKVGMSERTFQLEFKRRVGHSARKELQRLRLACASRLLRETDLKIEAIAVESGFCAASRLCEAVDEAYGLTPAVWRQRERGKL